MDQQNALFLGCLTLALAISAFILWGPSSRPRKRKGHVVGLVNLGSTCFLNTLLQALASCAIFIHWLMQQKQEENSLTTSLSQVMWVLNGDGKGDAHAPVEVLSALKRHGWMVPCGEQDAHELFHVIVSTLQDENRKVVKAASLSDALPVSDTLSQSSEILDDNASARKHEALEDVESCVLGESTSSAVIKTVKEKCFFAQGDTCNPKKVSNESMHRDRSLLSNETDKLIREGKLSSTESSTEDFYKLTEDTDKEVVKQCGDVQEVTVEPNCDYYEGDFVDNKNLSKFKTSSESIREKSYNFQGCFDRATGKYLQVPQADAPPFQGLLTSTLQCSACGYFSSLHYDTFDSLSLPLGDNFHFQVLKLQDLLRKFVKTEIIPEVECEKCCKKTTALKTMNFGKLPACLCLHIARTTWQNYSHTPAKRNDFIDFPEYLPMDEYTVSARLKKGRSATSVHSVNSSEELATEEKTYKHLYRLKSVVVHLGDVSSGHFLTYRRGALNSSGRHRIGKLAGAYKDSRRWYLTSDDNVKLSTLCEAMESLAYMLFYEKCSSDIFSGDDEITK